MHYTIHTYGAFAFNAVHLHFLFVLSRRHSAFGGWPESDVRVPPAVPPSCDGLIAASWFGPGRFASFLTHNLGRGGGEDESSRNNRDIK